jgi:TldD protein
MESCRRRRALPRAFQVRGLVFDNGRLKQASFDTSQGFGLRAVKARRSATPIPPTSEGRDPRASDAVPAVKPAAIPAPIPSAAAHQPALYGDENPLDAPPSPTR